jgi:hypothetical protein
MRNAAGGHAFYEGAELNLEGGVMKWPPAIEKLTVTAV